MGRVRRTGPVGRYTRPAPWDFPELDFDSWVAYWGSEDEARRAWDALADQYQPVGHWEPWWWYTAGVPADLRHYPHHASAKKQDAFEARRAAWLAEHGY